MPARLPSRRWLVVLSVLCGPVTVAIVATVCAVALEPVVTLVARHFAAIGTVYDLMPTAAALATTAAVLAAVYARIRI